VNRTQFRAVVRNNFRKHVRGGKVEFVWTFVGRSKGSKKERIVNGYFVHVKNGAAALWLAEWSEVYGLTVKECSRLHWQILAKNGQDGIKGGLGSIPNPDTYIMEG